MEPKFQSSFIPKGPISASPSVPRVERVSGQRDILSFLAMSILALSVIMALGTFGYKYYLSYRISQMGSELQSARQSLSPDVVSELLALDNRIASTKTLLNKHVILTPLFSFLESSTPKSVRYTEFDYESSAQGLELSLTGQAKSYAALSAAADILDKSSYFKNPVFSDLSLDDKGNVIFTFKGKIDPSLVSYEKSIENSNSPAQSIVPQQAQSAASTIASSTPLKATTTPAKK